MVYGDMVVSISLVVELTGSEGGLSDDSEAEAQRIKGLLGRLFAKL